MATIKAPVATFNGSVGGVQFANGEAVTDKEAVIAYCEAAGYKVTRPIKAEIELDGKATPAPAGNASREDWETFALLNGKTAEDLDGLGRDQIRELLADTSPAE